MEMNRFLLCFIVALTIASCSNSPELETGEIKTLTLIKQSFQKSKKSNQFVDARILLSREQIDAAGTPVLFIELESGQNGTEIVDFVSDVRNRPQFNDFDADLILKWYILHFFITNFIVYHHYFPNRATRGSGTRRTAGGPDRS